MHKVYLITDTTNGYHYVGQTTQSIKERWRTHEHHKKACCRKIHGAIAEKGKENFTVEVLHETESQEEADNLERAEIQNYDSIKHGYNMDSGGTTGYYHCEETRRRISESNKGRIISQESREKISKTLTGRTGYLCPNSKVVVCTTNNTEYGSASEAARILHLLQPSITSCCRGKLAQTEGYHFYYKDEGDRPHVDMSKRRIVMNADTGVAYETIATAAKAHNVSYPGICRSTKNGTQSAGCTWLSYEHIGGINHVEETDFED